MSPPPITIAQLPDDLLAHVLRFATDAARRDSGPTPCTSLADWYYAGVSTTFRRVFLRNVSSVLLRGPSAKALADNNWRLFDPCYSIRRFHISSDTELTDKELFLLFARFDGLNRPIRHIDIYFDNGITTASLTRLATTFGPNITHLAIRLPPNRRSWQRRGIPSPQNPFHPMNNLIHTPVTNPGAQNSPEEVPQQPLLPDPHLQQDAALVQILGGHPNTPNVGPSQQDAATMFAPPGPTPNPAPLQGQDDANEEVPMDIAHVMNEVHQTLFSVIHNVDGNPSQDHPHPPGNNESASGPPNGNNAPNHGNPSGNPAGPLQPHTNGPQMPNVPPDHMDVHSAETPEQTATLPQAGPAASSSNSTNTGNSSALPGPAEVANLVHSTNQLPPLLPAGHVAGVGAAPVVANSQPSGGETALEGAQNANQQRNNWYEVTLTDDELASALNAMLSLKVFLLLRARHITKVGITPLAQMSELESLTLIACPRIRDMPMKQILSSLKRLKSLHLELLPQVGNPTISALCIGPAKATIRKLRLVRMARISDYSIRQLVNACEMLELVQISDCANITCETASHLSCALRLKHILFKTIQDFPISNRTTIHLSCAASTVQSLELVGCKNLSLDGIVALGNLPSLRRLHLFGLQQVSQDVMRQLGVFPKLDDLLLGGNMYLTDLGVKVLCGQRGHRFLYLALIDRTKNLTDEALDCVMTWCISLRGLEIYGNFKSGALERLKDFIPNAAVRVCSESDGAQFTEGKGGVWDPVISGPHHSLA